jgi:protein-S-isoprenylcysteine O-methyltransferase Ste14
VIGVVLCLVGAVFVAQGTNALGGSKMMSGHPGWAVVGGIVIVIGLALLGWAWRVRRRRAA